MKGHIRKRGVDAYQLIYWVDGRQRATTVHGTRREAEAAMASIISDLSQGRHVAPAKQTLAAYLNQWLKETKPHVRPSTYRAYSLCVNLHAIPYFGDKRLSRIQPLDIQAFYRHLLENGKKGGAIAKRPGLTPSSVATIHRTLRRALNQAVAWGLLSQNPCARVHAPAEQRMDRPTLTPGDAQKLLRAAVPTGRASLYLAALTTGMRMGELLGLRWQDVDLENGTIHVRQQLDNHSKMSAPRFLDVKTARSRRTISMPDALRMALREERRIEDQVATCGCRNPYDLVWHVANGNPISPRNLDRQFKALLLDAGLPNMRFHDLRHTHATWLLRAGTHPKVVQERLGHSQISVTLDTYSHVIPALQLQAARDIDRLLQ